MINTLSMTLKTKGSAFIEKFLNEEVIISEKLDNYRFLFERKGDNVIFFTKDNKELGLISRTLSNIWEDPIRDISTIINEYTLVIPEGLRFGVSYTPVERPLRIPYSRLPKYILTDVTKRKGNEVIESLSIEEVEEWAGKLCLAKPPYIFKGILTEKQKSDLIKYDKRDFDDIVEDSFTDLIKNTFGHTYSNENIIEGIIISSKDKLAQIISYEFDLLNEAYEKSNTPRDFYDLLIINLNSFMDDYSMPILEAEPSKEQLYINIICDIFNNFCSKNKVFETLDPEYLMSPQYGYGGELNTMFIKNEETLQLIGKSAVYENLFKIILSSFRKTKKPYGLLTESIVEKFNTCIAVINSYLNINQLEVENLNESRSENIVVDTINKRKFTDVDNMRVIASIQKAFEPNVSPSPKGTEKCVVYFTTFQPFTLKQLENVKNIHGSWKVPIIVGAMGNKRRIPGNKFKFSDDLIKMQMKSLGNINNEYIKAFLLTESWSLYEIFEYCRPNFEPIALITDIGRKADFVIQLYFNEEVMGGRINVEKDFNIGEMENKDDLMSFRSIEDNNNSMFRELCPEAIYNFWDNMRGEYNTWNGILRS
jgi:hypothetical protein